MQKMNVGGVSQNGRQAVVAGGGLQAETSGNVWQQWPVVGELGSEYGGGGQEQVGGGAGGSAVAGSGIEPSPGPPSPGRWWQVGPMRAVMVVSARPAQVV